MKTTTIPVTFRIPSGADWGLYDVVHADDGAAALTRHFDHALQEAALAIAAGSMVLDAACDVVGTMKREQQRFAAMGALDVRAQVAIEQTMRSFLALFHRVQER